ncbi:hypothetical protein [Paenibacillus sp. HB172176]|uniref:hypothetical protein n=1 Tax=Paenibacillus sp. HB172176 TaxID=2493690 RepID=UPI00143C6892|nr:hypothetical protein [Paenibacillus sp. HB172176]
MMRQSALIFLVAALVAASGCGSYEKVQKSDYDYGSRGKNDLKSAQNRSYGTMSSNAEQHNNAYFEYSSMLSNKISSLNGVASAIVMLTDKNAYAGIMLDWTAVGTKNSGGTEEQNNGGRNRLRYNSVPGGPDGNSRVLASPYNSYFTVNDHNDISNELKQTIALLIRENTPSLQEVHISANMELVNYLNEFAKEAWSGHSLEPYLDDFNTVVQYFFGNGTVMPPPITVPGEYAPQQKQMRRR